MKDLEHRLQCACVRWFAYQHPELKGTLFAVPNGGQRNALVAAKLKDEGVTAGVADLLVQLASISTNKVRRWQERRSFLLTFPTIATRAILRKW